MDQLQQPENSTAVNPLRRVWGKFLRLCSWAWGIMAVIGGIAYVEKSYFLGIVCMLLGGVMLPPTRRFIHRIAGFKLAHPAAIAFAIFGVMIAIGHREQVEEKAEAERLMKIAKAEEQWENAFITAHPFVNRDSLRVWKKHAADSTKHPGNTLASFLERQQEMHRRHIEDSTADAKRWHDDSIASAKKWHADSILTARNRVKDSLAQVREARRLAAVREQENAPEMYNGHVVYTGPRGGKYYINSNGNKTYIDR